MHDIAEQIIKDIAPMIAEKERVAAERAWNEGFAAAHFGREQINPYSIQETVKG